MNKISSTHNQFESPFELNNKLNSNNRKSPYNFKVSPHMNKKAILQTNKNLIFELGQMHPNSDNIKVKPRLQYSAQSDISSPSKDF
jgi:hypothetical protein